MSSSPELRYEKRRAEAVVTLLGGETVRGWFFVAAGSLLHAGAERVGDLLNAEIGFFPFELHESGGRIVLYNRPHVVTVRVFEEEARDESGYSVAPREQVCRAPVGRTASSPAACASTAPKDANRLSDWARQPETFRYIESDESTLIVNAAHIVAVHEVHGS